MGPGVSSPDSCGCGVKVKYFAKDFAIVAVWLLHLLFVQKDCAIFPGHCQLS